MKILLAITGSISAYKSIDLARLLINEGHELKIILTKGAKNFVQPKVFTYLSAIAVYEDEDDFKHNGVLHVELGRWCDKLIIAPLSANTLSRLVQAQASDLLSSVFLAFETTKPILVFPAMNSFMLKHPFVESNFNDLKKLKTLNNIFISETNQGVLACNDEGAGKLPSVEEIKELIETINLKNISSKNILITTGATIAPLDPVRYLTNSSSGITGFYLAHNFLETGHHVTVIAGQNATAKLNLLLKHPHFKLIRTTTVDQMHTAVHAHLANANLFIASAAVSDIEFDYTDGKIKKDKMGDQLKIIPAKDILKSVIEKKSSTLKIVGFAAETDLSDAVLDKKLKNKPVDLLIGTKVHNGIMNETTTGFNNDNAFYRIKTNSKLIFEGELKKNQLGKQILTFFAKSLNQ